MERESFIHKKDLVSTVEEPNEKAGRNGMVQEAPHRGSGQFSVGRFTINWQYLIITAFVAYFIGLTFKPNDAAIDLNELPEIINRIKSLYVYFYLYGLAIMAGYLLVATPAKRFKLSPPLALFSIFFLYLIFRLLFGALPISKLIAALIGQILVTLFTANYFRSGRLFSRKVEDVATALSVWAVVYTVVNLIVLLAGYGYVKDLRFYGITAQPNFAGIALAIASISLFDLSVRKSSGHLSRLVCFTLCLSALYLCILTGTRTAVSMCVVLLFVYMYLQFGKSVLSKALVLMGFVLVVLLALLLINSPMFVEYEMVSRGDTRTTAWKTMIEGTLNNPLFGAGEETVGSESSYLRAFSFTGVIIGSIFMASILSAMFYAARMLSTQRVMDSKVASLPLFISTLLGLVWGGGFEGNLMELAGPWVFLYLVGAHIVFCTYRATIHPIRLACR